MSGETQTAALSLFHLPAVEQANPKLVESLERLKFATSVLKADCLQHVVKAPSQWHRPLEVEATAGETDLGIGGKERGKD